MDDSDEIYPITRPDIIMGIILIIAIGLATVLLVTCNPYRPQSTFLTPAIILAAAVILIFLIVFINVKQGEQN
jgi:glucan phosphoethanolaminetransferase (alkaline phosphatase superfamily)